MQGSAAYKMTVSIDGTTLGAASNINPEFVMNLVATDTIEDGGDQGRTPTMRGINLSVDMLEVASRADAQALFAAWSGRTRVAVILLNEDGEADGWSYNAFIGSISGNRSIEDVLRMSVTVESDGAITGLGVYA